MFNIVVITPETTQPKEFDVLQTVTSRYNCIIHVRKPHLNFADYKKYILNNKDILPHLVLHEHHELAKEYPVKGIHLKESVRNSYTEIGDGVKTISTSLHRIEDASTLTHSFEYVFYSPLFKSISKENYGTNTTGEALTKTVAELKKRTSIPIIGLGGINEENIALVKSSGFDGAAVLGAVWESENPVRAFENCLRRNA